MNCTTFGNSNYERYSRPLPIIGLYVAAASFVCAILIGLDLFHGFRSGRYWIANRFCSLNATTLTLLAIAAKIPSDLTTPMPGILDQFTKVSGTVLICIAMNHVMPSLDSMGVFGILSNVLGLGILVITVFVNIIIQLLTGVVSSFAYLNIMFSVYMLIIFVIFASYSLTVVTTRRMIEKEYDLKNQRILEEIPIGAVNRVGFEKLKEYLNKYWLMGLSSSSDYVLRSSGMSVLCTGLCHTAIGTTFIRTVSITPGESSRTSGAPPCSMVSDYQWSVALIFASQMLAILLGTITAAMRESNSNPSSNFMKWENLSKIEKRWVQQLMEWKESPIVLEKQSLRTRKIVRITKNSVLGLLIKLQICVILIIKFTLLIFLSIAKILLYPFLKLCKKKGGPVGDVSDVELREYVLSLEGEDDNIQAMEVVIKWKYYPQKWIQIGQTHQPQHFLNLIRRHVSRQRSSDGTSSGESRRFLESCRDCLSLPLVTLITIIHSQISKESIEELMVGVREGLRYVRFIEKNIKSSDSTTQMVQAAEMVWEGLDLDGRWLNIDLRELGSENWIGTIQKLNDLSHGIMEGDKSLLLKLVAAQSLLEITGTILSDLESGDVHQVIDLPLLQVRLEAVIAEMFCSCLNNLKLALIMQCSKCEFGEREEGVRDAALVLGETMEIIKVVEERNLEVDNL